MGRRTVELLVSGCIAAGCGPSVATTSLGTEGDSTGVRETDDAGTTGPDTGDATSSSGSAGSSPSTDGSTSSAPGDSTTTGIALDLTELRIEPAYAILDSATGGQPREFTAIGITDDGEEIDVTQLVEWSLEGPGTVDAGILTSPESKTPVFARAELSAEFNGLSAVAFAAVSVRTQGPHAPQLFNLNIEPLPRQLDFRPIIERIDVFFLIEGWGLLNETYLTPYYERIVDLIVPELEATEFDVQFGAGRFSAFPLEGAGEESCGEALGDQPFELWTEVSPNAADLEAGLAPLLAGAPIGCVYQQASFGEALYQIATGVGFDGPGATYVEPNAGLRGGVGFREDSLALVFSTIFTPLHREVSPYGPMLGEAGDVAHTAAEILDALRLRDLLHVGQTEWAGVSSRFPALAQLAVDTGGLIPPAAWNHPELGRPDNCAPDQCCSNRGDGDTNELSDHCPLAFRHELDDDPFEDPADNIRRDLYALTHYLLTDVTTTVVGEPASISGVPLRNELTTDAFIDLAIIDADDPPLEGMPTPILEDNVWRDVSPNTNLNYEVTVNADAVPSLPDEPLLYRVSVSLETGYRAGSVVQEYWIVSPPLEE